MKTSIFLFFITVLGQLQSHAQFNSSWVGSWSGDCDSTARQIGLPAKYILDFNIRSTEKDNTYAVQLKYKTTTNVIEDKNYLLVAVDLKKGHFKVDEKNSIYLDTYFTDKTMTSLFTINGRVFALQYFKNGDDITVIAPRWSAQPKTTSGGVAGIPAVASFEQLDIDTCLLKAIKTEKQNP